MKSRRSNNTNAPHSAGTRTVGLQKSRTLPDLSECSPDSLLEHLKYFSENVSAENLEIISTIVSRLYGKLTTQDRVCKEKILEKLRVESGLVSSATQSHSDSSSNHHVLPYSLPDRCLVFRYFTRCGNNTQSHVSGEMDRSRRHTTLDCKVSGFQTPRLFLLGANEIPCVQNTNRVSRELRAVAAAGKIAEDQAFQAMIRKTVTKNIVVRARVCIAEEGKQFEPKL
ncbi:hypothetical protein WDU94_000469 [Cyamophila willieti]